MANAGGDRGGPGPVHRRHPAAMRPGIAIARRDWRFAALSLGLVFLAHMVAYLAHEYSHSIVAWRFGWMLHPFSIDYGRHTLANLLFQQDVGDGVDYAPILRSGHGMQAALIALAGPGIGNGALYGVCVLALRLRAVRSRQTIAQFLFWLAMICGANLWSYAPIRTITTHADMALAARGFGISTWLLLPFVTIPTLLVLWHFFAAVLPDARRNFLPRGAVPGVFVAVLCCFFCFSVYGGPGLEFSYGEVPALLSIVSSLILFPLTTMLCLQSMPGSHDDREPIPGSDADR